MPRQFRLTCGLAFLLAFYLLVQLCTQGLGLWSLTRMHAQVAQLTRLGIDEVAAVNAATQSLMDARINLSRAATRMIGGRGEPRDIVDHARQSLQAANAAFGDYQRIAGGHGAQATALLGPFGAYRDALNELAGDLDRNDMQAFLDQPTQHIQDAFLGAQRSFITQRRQAAQGLLDDIDARLALFRAVALLVALLLIAIAFGVDRLVRAAVLRPLGRAGAQFELIAAGRLDAAIDTRVGVSELARLFEALRTMQGGLVATVRAVHESARAIELGANEIATGNADLSSRTEQQAAALEQTAASLDELTATIAHNAERAETAREAAGAARETTRGGETAAHEASAHMAEIAEGSNKIRDIIGVIDGIAFQTNILALNAAVEAARAGEQGRGFAVVAGEVRELAQRTAHSAKQIAALIGASVAQVQNGQRSVAGAGAAMQEVSGSIGRVAELMGEIDGATREQHQGIAQVNTAVAQIDGMTQQNAALVEQAAAAAHSLHTQTQQLNQAVAVFRLPA